MKIFKIIIFSLIPVIGLFLIFEIGGRVVYFQKKCMFASVTELAIHKARQTYLKFLAERKFKVVAPKESPANFFWQEEGRELRTFFMAQYQEYFQKLVREVAATGGKLLVVFLPTEDYDKNPAINDKVRAFYQGLCGTNQVPFLDLTPALVPYPTDWVTALPEEGHLSRLGNQIVAREIKSFIDVHFGNYRSAIKFSSRPKLFGDLTPGRNMIFDEKSELPYRLITNSQGLRMREEVVFPKRKQRILMLGDSFMYGPYLNNHDTISGLLGKMDPHREYINAGVCGYGIADEFSLFEDRAKYMEPDIVILQIVANDLYGFFTFQTNEFDRNRKAHKPSKEETEFFERLRQASNNRK